MNKLIKNFPFIVLLALIFPFKVGIFRTTDLITISTIPIYLLSAKTTNKFIINYISIIFLLCLVQPIFLIFNNNINILSSVIYSLRYISFPCLIFVLSKYLNHCYLLKLEKTLKDFEKLILCFLIINILFFGYQIVTGRFFGDYGLVTLGCNGATAFSAIQIVSIFFINTIINTFKEKNKNFILNLNFLISIILIFFGLSIGSRSATAVFISFIVLKSFIFIAKYFYVYLKTVKAAIKLKIKYIYNSFIFLIFIAPFSIFIFQFIINRGINLTRLLASLSFFTKTENIKMTRFEIVSQELERVPNIINFFIGNGFSYVESFAGNNVLRIGMHSQYSRFILEVGLIGLAIFLIPLLIIIKREFNLSIKSLLNNELLTFDFYSNLYLTKICFLIYFLSYDVLTISAGVIGMGFVYSLGFSLTKLKESK